MPTIRELYLQIENIEAQVARLRARTTPRNLTDEEFDQITRLQDQILDIEHPGYELKSWFESKDHPNDHVSYNVFCKESGVVVDNFDIYREGDKYLVRGYWKDALAAEMYAKQVLSRWF